MQSPCILRVFLNNNNDKQYTHSLSPPPMHYMTLAEDTLDFN